MPSKDVKLGTMPATSRSSQPFINFRYKHESLAHCLSRTYKRAVVIIGNGKYWESGGGPSLPHNDSLDELTKMIENIFTDKCLLVFRQFVCVVTSKSSTGWMERVISIDGPTMTDLATRIIVELRT